MLLLVFKFCRGRIKAGCRTFFFFFCERKKVRTKSSFLVRRIRRNLNGTQINARYQRLDAQRGGRRRDPGNGVDSNLFQALCQCGRLKKRACNEWGLVEKESRIPLAADPACRPLAFSIVFTDREPGTG